MGASRRFRLVTTVAVAAAVLVALYAWATSGAAGGSRQGRTASAPGSSTAPSSSTSSSTDPPTTVAATDPVYPVAVANLTLAAHNLAGTPVTIPTTVWYPSVSAGPFPLVVFSPGYQIPPLAYEPLTTAWAAAGYVVAEPTYPDTAPGAPQIETDMVNHPSELAQVINTLLSGGTVVSPLINPSEVGLAGQSDGGDVSLTAAANSAYRIPGIKALVVLSGAEQKLFGGSYFSGGNPPLLAVQGDQDTINPPGCSQQLYDGAADPRYYLDIPAASHLSAYTAAGPELNAVRGVTTAFLDGYLKGMTQRLAQLTQLGSVPGVSTLVTSTPVPITGSCLGAPPGV